MTLRASIETTAVALALTLSDGSGICLAQPADTASTAAVPPVEPEAMASLDRMGAYLRALRTFTVRSETTTDEVTVDDEKLQFTGTVSMQVRRPDRLRMEVSSDRKDRQFFYDGRTLTIFGQRVGYYATVPAPGTIRELIALAEDKYGVVLPLSDLFRWGAEASPSAAVKEAAVIGLSRVGGVWCDHVAVRQDDVDWQVWIERGKTPLPRKVVITSKTVPTHPQFVAVMNWNVAPTFDEATFRFSPPKGSHPIALVAGDAEARPK